MEEGEPIHAGFHVAIVLASIGTSLHPLTLDLTLLPPPNDSDGCRLQYHHL